MPEAAAGTPLDLRVRLAGRVFGRPDNEVTVLAADGTVTPLPAGRKDVVAAGVWDAVAAAATGSG